MGAAATVVVAVALLLVVLASASVVDVVAVLLMIVPLGVPAVTCTTTWKVAAVAALRSAFVQLIVPVAPTRGVLQAKVGPPVCISETNVVFAGIASVNATLCAPAVPLFWTVTV